MHISIGKDSATYREKVQAYNDAKSGISVSVSPVPGSSAQMRYISTCAHMCIYFSVYLYVCMCVYICM
jgi:hypothetical protein